MKLYYTNTHTEIEKKIKLHSKAEKFTLYTHTQKKLHIVGENFMSMLIFLKCLSFWKKNTGYLKKVWIKINHNI